MLQTDDAAVQERHWYTTMLQSKHGGGGKGRNSHWVCWLEIQKLFWVDPVWIKEYCSSLDVMCSEQDLLNCENIHLNSMSMNISSFFF